jgi:hypothetical protein
MSLKVLTPKPSPEARKRLEDFKLELYRDYIGRTNRLGQILRAEGKPQLERTPYVRRGRR